MVEMVVGMEALEGGVLTVLERLKNGKIEDAIACFAEEFSFKDHGVDLKFKNKERLAEFFRKARELYPDSLLQTDVIFASGDRVISEWTQQYTATEALLPAGPLKVPICLHGVSVVQIENGEITRWSDYYDGRTSRCTGLASYFTDWVEL
ncbi:nuclear transport factor 2 family protein [Edaphobacter aggregans]|uniref:nuclear transport factor 2 family protein n=1 Tax=Edaphobacter aggregans TaxID=570835 RepID=UPI00055313B0|nr:nuclear transport factor 2 family protein [Edaphobacter aggregans]